MALNTQDDGALGLADIEGDRKTNILRLASQVRWESQKELMKSRVKMLYYLDCLDTLEADLLQKSSLQLTSDSYGATPPWDLLHNLRTLDCLVYEVQNISVDLAKLETMETEDLMEIGQEKTVPVLYSVVDTLWLDLDCCFPKRWATS